MVAVARLESGWDHSHHAHTRVMSDTPIDSVAAPAEQVTRLLCEARLTGGEGDAASRLLPVVYDQLRELARQRLAAERHGHTLEATALVHEAYLRLVGASGDGIPWAGRAHFFFAAAEAMRRILIDHARARGGPRRGGGRQRVPLNNVLDLARAADGDDLPQLLALNDAVSRLEQVSASVAAVVRLRFSAGLSVDETAAAMGVSPRTVKREWTYARAWLARELRDDEAE
jgi:RNA polymerase sigma factor (TIGR02999 family)